MVGLEDPLGDTNHAAFVTEVEETLAQVQPGLTVRIVKDIVAVEGQVICTGSEGIFDSFEVLIAISRGFPLIEPIVWETRKRIPRVQDRHIYPDSGRCCICIWEEWLWDVGDPSFHKFLVGPIHSYFVSQSIFEMTGDWPFGERRHGKPGLIDAYRRMLDLSDGDDVEKYVQLLRQRSIKGHNECPCGSGKKVRDCHRAQLTEMKARIPSFLLQRMASNLRRHRRA